MVIQCLIIDDDKSTVSKIETVSCDFPEISVNNVDEDQEIALNTILKTKPDIVFVNIESHKIDFLEFLFEISQFGFKMPNFIGLSSIKQKAFDAYKYDFADFLLKPLSEISVRKSILKYQKKHPIKHDEFICLKSYKDYQYLNVDDILYLKADNNSTDFYMSDGTKISAYKTLRVFEELLPKTFLRIHKSYIINRNCISRIHYGKSICLINNEHMIPFTKTFIENIDLINNELTRTSMIALN